MNFSGNVIAVKDIIVSRKFYEELFNMKVEFDYGINIAYDCGLSLQQDFDWLTHIPKNEIIYKANNFELCFEEDDFDGFISKLKEYPDIILIHDVMEHSWGQRVIRFYDFDEHIIEAGENGCKSFFITRTFYGGKIKKSCFPAGQTISCKLIFGGQYEKDSNPI